ncbi:unnamed protein product [Eruca vesicaria subsp. sativa]|uniref:Uncharacterized protein n=1 Tax=Eruca vesicaria subsp. sativa TaxID=29727 RepID=A0ABC8KYF8_ERUVS|nr:unnamed protein product [Eruca vesicaria subsp. sativa]
MSNTRDVYADRNGEMGRDYKSSSDRVLRRRNDKSNAARRYDSRQDFGPYDRRSTREWREKPVTKAGNLEREGENLNKFHGKAREMTAPALPSATSSELGIAQTHVEVNGGESGSGAQCKKMASIIVSPPLRTATMEDNVTIRSRSATRSLSFVEAEAVEEGEQVIDALTDMEINDTDEKMINEEYDDADDDLLGEEFMEASEEKRVGAEVVLRNKGDTKKRSGRLITSSSTHGSKPGWECATWF